MDSNKLREVLYAYSAGCLEKEDYPLLVNYLNSASESFASELTDTQNILALIPTLLEIEQPNQKVKDKVARKLYRMRNESRQAKKPLTMNPIIASETTAETNKTRTAIGETDNKTVSLKSPSYVPLSEHPAAAEQEIVTEKETGYKDPQENPGFEPEEEVVAAENNLTQMSENKALKLSPEKAESKNEIPEVSLKKIQETPTNATRSKGLLYFVICILTAILLCSGTYYIMSKEVTESKKQVASLSTQISTLSSEMEKMEKNQRVLSLLGAKDTKTYSLDATEANPKGFGKLTISSEGKEGVLQLYNMPALSGNQVYQLWVTNKNQSISMGAFIMKRDVEYFPVEQLPMDQNQIESFIVTLEDNGGSAAPSKKICLLGLVNKI